MCTLTIFAQIAVSNRHPSIDQQLYGWLLLSLGRLFSNRLVVTRELIANMLRVGREGCDRKNQDNSRVSLTDPII
jgi:hypothetical protein